MVVLYCRLSYIFWLSIFLYVYVSAFLCLSRSRIIYFSISFVICQLLCSFRQFVLIESQGGSKGTSRRKLKLGYFNKYRIYSFGNDRRILTGSSISSSHKSTAFRVTIPDWCKVNILDACVLIIKTLFA